VVQATSRHVVQDKERIYIDIYIPHTPHTPYLLDPEVRPSRASERPAPPSKRAALQEGQRVQQSLHHLPYWSLPEACRVRRSPTDSDHCIMPVPSTRPTATGNLPAVRATRNHDRRRSPHRCKLKEETKASPTVTTSSSTLDCCLHASQSLLLQMSSEATLAAFQRASRRSKRSSAYISYSAAEISRKTRNICSAK